MHMDRLTFEIVVERALTKLPGKFRAKLKNIIVEVEDEPSREVLDDMGIEHGTLYGLYQGVPLTEREWNYGNMLPDRIVIYQRPIEMSAASAAEMEEIVVDTVIHEIGHYFGFNDAELSEMEREREQKKKGPS